jgi:beta-glucosidase
MNGRPLDITAEVKNADAVLEAWFPGTMGGQAIAEIIYGKTNPSAKLAISFPVNVGQVPVFYSNKTTGRPMNPKNPKGDYRSFYQDIPNKPLFSFGYGLSYSNFEYSNVTLDKKVENTVEVLDFSVSVKNTSKIDGYEIVQLYIQDVAASITRPAKELKGFEKVWIKAGEEQTVHFKLTKEDLGFWNQGEFRVEAGTYKFTIAPNSDADLTNSFILE